MRTMKHTSGLFYMNIYGWFESFWTVAFTFISDTQLDAITMLHRDRLCTQWHVLGPPLRKNHPPSLRWNRKNLILTRVLAHRTLFARSLGRAITTSRLHMWTRNRYRSILSFMNDTYWCNYSVSTSTHSSSSTSISLFWCSERYSIPCDYLMWR